MKVRLKLTLEETRALCRILSWIFMANPLNIASHIYICEAERLWWKLTNKLLEPPKKHYRICLTSVQIIALLSYDGAMEDFERVVYRDILAKTDKQYVSEVHHNTLRRQSFITSQIPKHATKDNEIYRLNG